MPQEVRTLECEASTQVHEALCCFLLCRRKSTTPNLLLHLMAVIQVIHFRPQQSDIPRCGKPGSALLKTFPSNAQEHLDASRNLKRILICLCGLRQYFPPKVCMNIKFWHFPRYKAHFWRLGSWRCSRHYGTVCLYVKTFVTILIFFRSSKKKINCVPICDSVKFWSTSSKLEWNVCIANNPDLLFFKCPPRIIKNTGNTT